MVSKIEDEDGEEMYVCFFPTVEQKIYFRVLKEFDNDKNFIKATGDLYSITSNKEREANQNTVEIDHRPKDITEVISEHSEENVKQHKLHEIISKLLGQNQGT